MPQDPKEFFIRIEEDINQRFLIASSFLALMLLLKILLGIRLPDILFVLVSLLPLLSIPVDIFFKQNKEKNPFVAINSYLIYVLSEVSVLAFVINFIGGIAWVGFSFYLFYTINAFWIFPKTQAFFVTIWIILVSLFLISGTYLKIFPYFDLFPPEKKGVGDFPFVFTSTIISFTILGFLAYASDSFHRLLEKTVEELGKKSRELSFTKQFLEREVERRTRELQEERTKITREVREKTKELAEKKGAVELEVKKLEDFYQKAVSRELELVAMKKKITQLKELKYKK